MYFTRGDGLQCVWIDSLSRLLFLLSCLRSRAVSGPEIKTRQANVAFPPPQTHTLPNTVQSTTYYKCTPTYTLSFSRKPEWRVRRSIEHGIGGSSAGGHTWGAINHSGSPFPHSRTGARRPDCSTVSSAARSSAGASRRWLIASAKLVMSSVQVRHEGCG